VADVQATPVEPGSFLDHASTALREAQGADPGDRIRAYRA
jgi:hypothetical protein